MIDVSWCLHRGPEGRKVPRVGFLSNSLRVVLAQVFSTSTYFGIYANACAVALNTVICSGAGEPVPTGLVPWVLPKALSHPSPRRLTPELPSSGGC